MKDKRNVLRKDFYMEIKKSVGRFISIFFIVALGVAFFSGIRVAEPDLRLSGDAYFDRNTLMDIQVLSTMGITEEDIETLEKIDGVEKVEAGYSVDALCTVEGNQQVLHVLSGNDSMNQFVLEEGRSPKAADECLVDAAFMESTSYEIGDTLKLESGTKDNLKDSLKYDEFRIVGTGSSPRYISFGRGSSTIGTGEVSGFLAVDESAFCMEVYTEACILVDGAKEEIAFTDGYQKKVDKVIDAVEKIKDYRCLTRDEEIHKEAWDEIEKAQKELDDGKKEADEKLSKAKKELDDGEKLLNDSKKQIEDGKAQLADGEKTLSEQENQWQQGDEEYTQGKAQIEKEVRELEAQQKSANAQFAFTEKQLADGRAAIESRFAETKEQLDQEQQKCDQARTDIEKAKENLPVVVENIENLNIQITGYEKICEKIRQQISEAQTEEEKEQLQKELAQMETTLDKARAELEQLEETKGKMEEAIASLPLIEQAEQELAKAWEQYDAGYAKAMQELTAKEQEFVRQKETVKAKFSAAEEQLLAAQKKLESSSGTLASAKEQLDIAKKEIAEQKETLARSEDAIRTEQQKLEDGKKEYISAEEEARKEIADGEEKLATTKEEIAGLAKTTWYVNDRTALPEYEGFGQNADRMKAIGQVFPILFFLVAALISLTTMTRMVEEERTQIGTLKALGYSKGAIVKKYLGYALLATFGGSVFGFLLGEKIFPYIIVYAYQIMYPYVPDIVVPYDLSYGIQAAGAALLCTGIATGFSCFRELTAQPAELMRPPAPKQGKRIFLERVSIIWKHLNFTWKSTCRNIFRYKKRFFMTVLGTGGCMALMIVGFGLKDSIYDIGNLQYGELQVYDATAYIKDDIEEEQREEIRNALAENKEVEGCLEAELKLVNVKKGKQTGSVYLNVLEEGKDLDKFMSFRNRKTKETYDLYDTARDGNVILTEKMAKKLEVEEGDTITVEKNGKSVEVTIGEICENYMSHYLYLTESLYEELFGEEPVYNSVMFAMKETDAHKLEETGEKLLTYDGVQNVSYSDSLEKRLDDMLKSLNLVIVVLIISAGMLAFVVLYNLSNINITERKRELATLKVLGFYDREVSAYVYRENVLLTLIGAAVGCVLGKLLHQYVIVTVEIEEVMFGRNVNVPSFFYSLFFTIVFALIVNWVMYYKLKRIDMVESLKSIE